MSTKKQLGKGDDACQRSPNILQLFKNNSSKNVIKNISMSTCIMTQSRCSLRKALMPKGMVSQPSKVDIVA
jgi:hypothetical protein